MRSGRLLGLDPPEQRAMSNREKIWFVVVTIVLTIALMGLAIGIEPNLASPRQLLPFAAGIACGVAIATLVIRRHMRR
jgi:hypothetical protein